jgi:hypothetical protein
MNESIGGFAESKIIPLFFNLNKNQVEGGCLRMAKNKTMFRLNGKRVPSVTTILGVIAKPALYIWHNQKGLEGIDTQKFVDDLARIGSLTHEMIQEHLGGDKWDRDTFSETEIEQAETPFGSFLEWEEKGKYRLETKNIEMPLVSDMGFGGKIDWYGTFNGQSCLMDIKTSKIIYPEHLAQLAAYNKLLLDNGLSADTNMIMRVGRTEAEGFECRIVSQGTLDIAFDVFMAAFELYKTKQSLEKIAA